MQQKQLDRDQPKPDLSDNRPLVVDLDGTLFSGDVLHEDLTAYVLKNPHRAWRTISWLRAGLPTLKSSLAEHTEFDATSLPYNQTVLEWLRAEHASGRSIVLATASTFRRATAIAEHLAIFDSVIATEDGVNLKAARKRELLIERYGEGGYEYVGNHRDDLAVWAGASVAHVVGGSRGLADKAGLQAELGKVIPISGSRWRNLIRALRPHQWMKNLLLFVALFTAQDILHEARVLRAIAMFISFCLVSSSVYILNDMSDLIDDRHHPSKRRRPFASGQLSLLQGWVSFPLLLLAGFGLAVAVEPLWACLTLLGYYVATVAYTFALKREPIMDVVTLALLYTIRIVAGAAAIKAPMTIWLLTFSTSIFMSLALVKRVSELTRIRDRGGSVRGRGYSLKDLSMLTSLGVTASYSAIVVLALYVHDRTTAHLYRKPSLLWLAVPILLYWCSRLWLLADRGEIDEDPVLFAARDRISWVVILLTAAVFASAKFIR